MPSFIKNRDYLFLALSWVLGMIELVVFFLIKPIGGFGLVVHFSYLGTSLVADKPYLARLPFLSLLFIIINTLLYQLLQRRSDSLAKMEALATLIITVIFCGALILISLHN